jgi:hypothetical protein
MATFSDRMDMIAVEDNLWSFLSAILTFKTIAFENLKPQFFAYWFTLTHPCFSIGVNSHRSVNNQVPPFSMHVRFNEVACLSAWTTQPTSPKKTTVQQIEHTALSVFVFMTAPLVLLLQSHRLQ